ncbi:MAG: PKD domain-containing protein [Bacteroidetes bacterium]|nr:PKD domain-containing protein [Bacteroidota bacterium]
MKKKISIQKILNYLCFAVFLTLCVINMQAQNTDSLQKPTLIGMSEPRIEVPSIASQIASGTFIPAKNIVKEMNDEQRGINPFIPGKGLPVGIDPLLQKQAQVIKSPGIAPLLTFEAAIAYYIPSDPTGAVGPNHFVNAWNISFRIWDKAGNALTPPASLGTILPGTEGDPTVVYDRYADRFLISEFFANGFDIAISKGPDPVNDGWYVYRFPTNTFPDYPKLSVWSDGYYITTNKDQNNASTSEVVFVVERDKMINGDFPAQMVGFPLTNIVTNHIYSPLGFNVNGSNMPPPGNAPIVYMQDDAWAGVSNDHLKIWNINVNWTTPANSTISTPQILNTQPFDGDFFGGGPYSHSILPQPSGSGIDAWQDVIMYMAQYRRFSGYNSVVFNFVVDLDGNDNHAGIRWFELRQTNDGAPWTIYQEGTYIQPDGHSAFMGSMCMDSHGNIGLAYSVVSSTQYPSLRFTGRHVSDPLGTMTIDEWVIINGTQSIPYNRYGDYSQMTIDPVDDATFWSIGEYFEEGHRKSRVGVFQIAPPDLKAQFAGTPTTICRGDMVTFTNQSLGSPTSWTWSFPGGIPSSYIGQNPPFVTYYSTGTYDVSLTVSDGISSDTETKTGYVTLKDLIAGFTGTPVNVVIGNSVTFTDHSACSPAMWDWSFPGGTPASFNGQVPPSIIYNTPGTYDVSLTVTKPDATDTKTRTGYITITNPLYNMTNGSITACAGTFYDSGGPSANYQNDETLIKTFYPSTAGNMMRFTFTWFDTELNYDTLTIYNGVNSSAPVIGKYHGMTSPGVVTAANSSGALTFRFHSDNTFNSSGWAATISCQSTTVPPIADFSASMLNPPVGQTTTFTDISANLPTSFLWSFNPSTVTFVAGTGATSQNPQVLFLAPGQNTVTLTATNAYGSDTEIKTNYISVNSTSYKMANGSITTCAGDFYDSGGPQGYYQNDENFVETFYPSIPGSMIRFNFTSFFTEPGFDYLRIYNGPNTSAPLVGIYNSTISPGTVTAENVSGALTFEFTSDYRITCSGWSAGISCHGITSAPVADFTASATDPPVNSIVIFTDQSTNFPTSRAWSFTPGTVVYKNGTNASSQNPQVQFTVMGPYTVSLTVTNAFGSDTETKSNYINPNQCEPCASTSNNAIYNWISNVIFNTINNPSEGVYGYQDFTGISTTVCCGSVYPISISTGSTNPVKYNCCAFFDWNQDCDFYEQGETFDLGQVTGPGMITMNIPVPTNALPGSTRMRVSLKYAYNLYACETFKWGQVEDYTVTIPFPPMADFSASDTTPNTGQEVQFNDESINSPTSWAWSFSPSTVTYKQNTSSISENPIVTFNEVGLYTVTLIAANCTRSDTAVKTGYILVANPPVANFSANILTPYTWQTVNFTDLSTNNPTGWMWSFEPSTVDFQVPTTRFSQNPMVQFRESGLYSVTFGSWNAGGGSTMVKTNYISVLYPPVANFSANDVTPYIGQTITFTDLSTNSPEYWEWSFTPATVSFTGGTDSHTKSPQVQFTAGGLYSVTLTAYNGSGFNTAVKTNYISVLFPPVADFSANDTTPGIGGEVRFTDASTNSPTAWLWSFSPATASFSGGTNAESKNPRIKFNANGSYTITLTATNASGSNTKLKANYISVRVPGADFTADNIQPGIGQTVTFTDHSVNPPTSWAWSYSPATVSYVGGTSSSSQNPQVQFTAIGSYTVTLIASNSYGSGVKTKTGYIHVPNCSLVSLPLSETFSVPFQPACWSQVDHQGNGQVWKFGMKSGGGALPSLSGNYAYLDSYTYGSGNSQNADLITPLLDLTPYTNVNLQFKHYFRSQTGSSGTLSYSINNGASWVQIQQYTVNSTTNPVIFNQVITAVAGQSQVKFKWNYTGSNGQYWAFDDVQITATCAAYNPVSISISASANPVAPGTSVTFTATPVNGGGTPIYQWKVNDQNAGTSSPDYSYIPLNNDIIKCILTSDAACITGNPATSGPVTMMVTNVPPTLTLQNDTLTGAACFNAYQTISVAGNGTTFHVQDGGTATLIAGQNILCFPGTTVFSGGYLRGYILPGVPDCTPSKISITADSEIMTKPSGQSIFKVFPNPTSGIFTLELSNEPIKPPVVVQVFNMMGSRILETEIRSGRRHQLSLSDQVPGVYLVKVVKDNETGVSKIIREQP